MKKRIVLLLFLSNSCIFTRDLLIVPYAFHAGQAYCLFLKSPDKLLMAINDVQKKEDELAERAAKVVSLQTRALWGKYEKDSNLFYKRRPSKNDYYQSISFFKQQLAEASAKELVMKTERYIISFVEVPYIQHDWLHKAPHLAEGLESWFVHYQLVWVKMQALFESKADGWKVKKRIVGIVGQIDDTTKNRLDQFGHYNADGLTAIMKNSASPFDKILRRSVARQRAPVTHYAPNLHSPVYGSRLRRSRRINR